MLKNHLFFSDFKHSMRSRGDTPYYLDDGPYFITWPLVYLLKKTGVSPNQIGLLSFLSGISFLVGLLQGFLQTHPYVLAFILTVRILLDCIDGQLARYAGQTSNLGALYDLASDFIFTVLLFLCFTYLLIVQNEISPLLSIILCIAAFLSFVATATLHSYIVLLEVSSECTDSMIKERFLGNLPNDHPQDPAYTKKLIFFSKLFAVTWRPVSLIVAAFVGKDIPQKKLRFLRHAFSLTEYGMHLVILWVIVVTQSSLTYFLIYEIVAFCVVAFVLSPIYKRLAID